MDFGASKPATGLVDDCNTCDVLGAIHTAQLTDQPQLTDHDYWQDTGEAPSIIELGQSGWTLLHTIAAYYPSKPTNEERRNTSKFLKYFAKTFPCDWCGDDFAKIMDEHPPKLDNYREFSQWMCEAHNTVNHNLGKPGFDCSLVDQRWKL
eukprot:TRINITY_DN11811_c0_g1_i1.p1 TRINITY_DN11811_c0_g1~~TRINITY_DN11811_c0_g1_i1.p1  ORF type:complete len:150 (+),score=28.80 TRINITY_DN11811_c0_g1_i1:37-486(+)